MLKRIRGKRQAATDAHDAHAAVDVQKGQMPVALLPSLLEAQAGLKPRCDHAMVSAILFSDLILERGTCNSNCRWCP